MKKKNSFAIIKNYLKDEKLKVFFYLILVLTSYLPSLLSAFFWGFALEALIKGEFNNFAIYLIIWESIWILFYAILSVPRDFLYNYLEIKFMRNVSKDLYRKITDLPARSFEEIGVGEFINRLYTDPDRVISLLSSLVRILITKFTQ